MTEQTEQTRQPEQPAQPGRTNARPPGSGWWLTAVLGALVLVPGPYVIYRLLDAKEQEGGSFRANWLFVLAYDTFGKTGCAVLCAVIGAGVLIASWSEYQKYQESRRQRV